MLEDLHCEGFRTILGHEAAPLGVVLDKLADVVARDGEGLRVGLGDEEGDECLERRAVLGLEGLVVVLPEVLRLVRRDGVRSEIWVGVGGGRQGW